MVNVKSMDSNEKMIETELFYSEVNEHKQVSQKLTLFILNIGAAG